MSNYKIKLNVVPNRAVHVYEAIAGDENVATSRRKTKTNAIFCALPGEKYAWYTYFLLFCPKKYSSWMHIRVQKLDLLIVWMHYSRTQSQDGSLPIMEITYF